MDYSENMSTTDTLDLERLGSEDIEFLKTLRRTFESMSVGNRSRVEGEITCASSQNKPMTMCSQGTAPETHSDTSRPNGTSRHSVFVS